MKPEESNKLIEELMTMNKKAEEQNIALEMEVKASKQIIKKLKKDNVLLTEYEEAIIDKDDLIRKFEKGKMISDNVIRNLQQELQCRTQVNLQEREELLNEKDTLEKDISELQKENKFKEEMIKTINIEKEMLENKILKLKEEKAEVVSTNVQTDLHFPQNENDVKFIACDICNERFPNVDDIQSHKNSC